MEGKRPYPVDSFSLRRLDLPQLSFYFPRSKQLENAVPHQEGIGPTEPAFGGRVWPLRCLRRLQEQLPNMERRRQLAARLVGVEDAEQNHDCPGPRRHRINVKVSPFRQEHHL